MKLRKLSEQVQPRETVTGNAVSRRDFLRNSGLMAGGAVLTTGLGTPMMRKAQAATKASAGAVQQIKTICTHCAVGSGIVAEVQNGVWRADRSRPSITRSIWVRTVPKGLR